MYLFDQKVANGRMQHLYISTVDAYVDGSMPAELAWGELIKEELKHQVCISNQLIIDQYLTFQESIIL